MELNTQQLYNLLLSYQYQVKEFCDDLQKIQKKNDNNKTITHITDLASNYLFDIAYTNKLKDITF